MVNNVLPGMAESIEERGDYSTAIVEGATKQSFLEAFSDPEARFILIYGHGGRSLFAGVETSDGEYFEPSDLIGIDLSKSLKTVVFLSCFQEELKEQWVAVLPEGTRIVAWPGLLTTEQIHSLRVRERIQSGITFAFGEPK